MKKGRPSFKLDTQYLRRLRKERQLTQSAMSKAISSHYPSWGCNGQSSEETMTADYQRIEAKGRTSPQVAEVIAKVLDVPIAFLQGEVLPDSAEYLKKITLLLNDQIATGENKKLMLAYSEFEKANAGKGLERLAEDISKRIEVVQLGRNPSELADLIEYTGLSKTEILMPANCDGHWFVTTTFRESYRVDILQSTVGIWGYICDRFKELPRLPTSDESVRIWRDGFWYRIEIYFPLCHSPARIDFVRCEANEHGVRWCKPMQRDELSILSLLKDWSFHSFNFSTLFDGAPTPQIVEQLRFKIIEFENGSYGDVIDTQYVTVDLDEFRIYQDRNKNRGQSHRLLTEWLLYELKNKLYPILITYPAEYWSVSGGEHIEIFLKPSYADRHIGIGIRYRIQLVEELPSGKNESAPWRYVDIERAKKTIESWLISSRN